MCVDTFVYVSMGVGFLKPQGTRSISFLEVIRLR